MMYDSSSANIIRDLEDTRKGSEIFLLGLTGGIASGKSTVAEMLEKMGSPLIDFDILARYVVRPNEPSWRCIVDFFGRDILNDDETIDRKRLSGIVFRDIEKRRKLESFTHPFIWNEFVNQVRKIGSETKNVIITCVIPLLIEGGREEIFDRIVLVYSCPELQIERLMKRDGIDRQRAIQVLRAQMPIDKKRSVADYIIHNETTPDRTEEQVKALWNMLKETAS